MEQWNIGVIDDFGFCPPASPERLAMAGRDFGLRIELLRPPSSIFFTQSSMDPRMRRDDEPLLPRVRNGA
jgi:hypothetical protein